MREAVASERWTSASRDPRRVCVPPAPTDCKATCRRSPRSTASPGATDPSLRTRSRRTTPRSSTPGIYQQPQRLASRRSSAGPRFLRVQPWAVPIVDSISRPSVAGISCSTWAAVGAARCSLPQPGVDCAGSILLPRPSNTPAAGPRRGARRYRADRRVPPAAALRCRHPLERAEHLRIRWRLWPRSATGPRSGGVLVIDVPTSSMTSRSRPRAHDLTEWWDVLPRPTSTTSAVDVAGRCSWVKVSTFRSAGLVSHRDVPALRRGLRERLELGRGCHERRMDFEPNCGPPGSEQLLDDIYHVAGVERSRPSGRCLAQAPGSCSS